MPIKVAVTDGIVVLLIQEAMNVVIRDIVLNVKITNTVKLENLEKALPNLLPLVNHNPVHRVNQAQVLLVHLLLQSHKPKHLRNVKEPHCV